MTPTAKFVETLASLKPGDLGKLRKHAGLTLDESVNGFDLFAGVWWPLREKNQRAPRREVAWLIAKLYGFCPIPHEDEVTLALQMGKLCRGDENAKNRYQQRFDDLRLRPLSQIEPDLQWAIRLIAKDGRTLDWVRLTDNLSIWEREDTRIKWAKAFLAQPS